MTEYLHRIKIQQARDCQLDFVTLAYHEAGHAVAGFHYGCPFKKISLLSYDLVPEYPGKSVGGIVDFDDSREPSDDIQAREWVRNAIIATYCGPIAERKVRGRYNHGGAKHDLQKIIMAGEALASDLDQELMNVLDQVAEEAEVFLNTPQVWKEVEAVATALLKVAIFKNGVLTAAEVEKTIQAAGGPT